MTAPLASDAQTYDCRKAFAEQLIELAHEDDRIVAVCNDSVGSSNLVAFRETFPERLINVGIAEQDLVGVGAGLANGGLIPFVSAAAPFLTGRALEQIKADAAYSDVPVILCGQSPGMAYGELGPTHHSIEDLSWTRAIANLKVVVPADRAQTRSAVRWAAAGGGPVYMRIPRFKVPDVTPDGAPFGPGTSVRLTDGDDVTIVAVGTMVSRALDAAERLREEGIGARVHQHRLRRPPRRPGDPRRRARDRGDRHRGGGHAERRARRRRRGPRRRAPARPDADPRDPRRVRAHRQRLLPARPLRAQRRRHRPRRARRGGGPHGLSPMLLAIDQGTSATKAVLVDAAGRIVARGSAPVGQAHPQPGWVEQSADRDLGQRRAPPSPSAWTGRTARPSPPSA